jgi:hypothetical protein
MMIRLAQYMKSLDWSNPIPDASSTYISSLHAKKLHDEKLLRCMHFYTTAQTMDAFAASEIWT